MGAGFKAIGMQKEWMWPSPVPCAISLDPSVGRGTLQQPLVLQGLCLAVLPPAKPCVITPVSS